MPPIRNASSSPESNDNGVRKRVGKACDRCRLKKSKCNGECPCTRCKSDDVLCVYGERKKAHDKTYPKGYVELLEHQHVLLVSGIQELYARAVIGEIWPGQPLENTSQGRPLTQDILERIGTFNNGEGTPNNRLSRFEDDLEYAQVKLFEQQETGKQEPEEQTPEEQARDQELQQQQQQQQPQQPEEPVLLQPQVLLQEEDQAPSLEGLFFPQFPQPATSQTCDVIEWPLDDYCNCISPLPSAAAYWLDQ